MNKFFVFICVLFSQTLLLAQSSSSCFSFVSLPADTSYAGSNGTSPNEVVFEDDNFQLRIDSFYQPNFVPSEYYAASVLDNPFGIVPDVGRGIFLGAVTVFFDSDLPVGIPSRTVFSIIDGGGEKSLLIDGRLLPKFERWEELDEVTAPNVRIRVLPNEAQPEITTVIIEGNYQSIGIGGNEQFVYEYCVQSAESNFCRISNLQVTPNGCVSDESYTVLVDFEYESEIEENFSFFVGDQLIDSFLLIDFPIEIELPYSSSNSSVLARVCVNGRSDCCASVEFRPPNCRDCSIVDVQLIPTECDSNGQYMMDVFVEARNGSETGFFIRDDVLDQTYGPFSYADSLVRVGPFFDILDIAQTLTVFDAEEEDCFIQKDIFPVCPPCYIEDVSFVPQACDDTGRFMLELIVTGGGSEAGYFVGYEGGIFGPFSYTNSSVMIGPIFSSRNAPAEIIVYDAVDSMTCFLDFIVPFGCEDVCDLSVVVEPRACDENGLFFLDLFVENTRPDTEYVLELNGLTIEVFNPQDSIITVGPFDGNIDAPYELSFFDVSNENCRFETRFLSPCFQSVCEELTISGQVSPCENNEFTIALSIENEEAGFTNFFIQVNETLLLGPYAYDSTGTEIEIGPFQHDEFSAFFITVIDVNDRQCRANVQLRAPNCAAQCAIDNLQLDVGEICRLDGRFPLFLSFDINNPIGNAYSIFIDNQFFGRYSYVNNPVTFPNFTLNGRDSATIAIVPGDNRACALRQMIVAPECSIDSSEVWPGDTNDDGIANHLDLLNIGLAYGATGPERFVQATNWAGQPAPRWSDSFSDELNYKHADANGDGLVFMDDIAVIQANYGETRESPGSTPGEDSNEVIATEGDPSIFVDLPEIGMLPSGAAFSVPVILGSENRSVESVYGIAFTIEYDANLIDPNQLRLSVPDSWLGDAEEDLLTIQKAYPDEGKIEIAISRTDGQSVTGYGVVALMSGIIVDLVGLRTTKVKVSKVRAIRPDNTIIPIYPDERSTIISDIDDLSSDAITVFPNPTNGVLSWTLPSSERVVNIELLNVQGKRIQQYTADASTIDISNFPEGIYFLRLQTTDGFHYTKVMKI